MRLLFDQNLSFRLCTALAAVFPDSSQVHLLGLQYAEDHVIWDFARTHGFTVVSQDSDFADLAAMRGPPPQVIWLRCGNRPTAAIAALLVGHLAAIRAFEHAEDAACLELY